jgi:hypothetical protein
MLGEVMLRASLGTTLALLGALGATAAGTLTANASPAGVPADTFTVVSAGVSAINPDLLTVTVDSSTQITDLTASLYSGTTDELDQPLTLMPGSTTTDPAGDTQSTWTAAIPVGTSPNGLALGSYTINLAATYSDSNPSSVTDAGAFSFLATSAVTLAAANTNLGYPNTEAGLSGTVTLTNPDGTADTNSVDYTGLSVNIIDTTNNQIVQSGLSVSSTGAFSDPDYQPGATETVVAQVTGSGTVASGESSAVTLTVTSTTPALSLKVNPVTETYGKSVMVTGTLTYTSGSTSEPLAGQEIWIGNQEWDWGSPLVTGTTGTDGSFSITLPAQQAGATLYVGTLNTSDLTAVETPLQVNVVNPTVISSFKVSLNQYWTLSVSGCLGFASGNTTQTLYHTSGLTVQYAPSTRGPWKNLFAINGNESYTPCGTGGIKFTGSHIAPENYAYYRVVYAGTKGATSYASTTSPTVLTWKYADRITNLRVSPTVVNAGGKLTVSGTLQYYYSGWHNYSGQIISIDLHPQGSNPTWYWFVKVKTNSQGQFSATFKDPVSATWQAVFEGNTTGVGHLSAGSSEVYVRLK